jgi:GT2 family glycosyltransferase
MKVSIVIPTHNRPAKLRSTLEKLRAQSFSADEYEVVVVDDGSNPPVIIDPELRSRPEVRILRLEGEERSVARNKGAKEAKGELLIFVDDDIETAPDFVSSHWAAHQEFSDALAVGAIHLPEESQKTPFGRFRQRLEMDGIPRERGLVNDRNFCAAANASIKRDRFLQLGGFDTKITSAEDQDFALRHSVQSGRIVFLPEARVIHQDNALSIREYCKRNEWGSRLMLPFYQRYRDFPANLEREKINGSTHWGSEPFSMSLRKTVKAMIAGKLSIGLMFFFVDILERILPNSGLLDKFYRVLLGAHIFRGYRAISERIEIGGNE